MQKAVPSRTVYLVLSILNLITQGTENLSLGNKVRVS